MSKPVRVRTVSLPVLLLLLAGVSGPLNAAGEHTGRVTLPNGAPRWEVVGVVPAEVQP